MLMNAIWRAAKQIARRIPHEVFLDRQNCDSSTPKSNNGQASTGKT